MTDREKIVEAKSGESAPPAPEAGPGAGPGTRLETTRSLPAPTLTGTAYICGINHERAELALRERFAMAPVRCEETLARIREEGLAEEALVLSTCNRTEIYAFAPAREDFGKRLREFFLSLAKVSDRSGEEAEHHAPLYNYEAIEATRHFFAVNAGLNSMILGENEIKNQVKRAFDLSVRMKMAGPNLHRLVEWANRSSKRIRTSTELNTGTLSVGKAAILRAEEILGTIEGKVCVVIGAGKVGRIAAEALAERRPKSLHIVNRTRKHAEEVARGLDAHVCAIGDIPDLVSTADLVLGAAFAPNFLVTRNMFEAARSVRQSRHPVCLVDTAVPRILDHEIGTLDGVKLIDIGDLEVQIAINREKRITAAQHAWEIVEDEMEKFHAQLKTVNLGPVIESLKQRFDIAFGEEEAEFGDGVDEELRRRHRLSQHRLKQRLLHEAIDEIKKYHKNRC